MSTRIPGTTYEESEQRAVSQGTAETIVAIVGGATKGSLALTSISNATQLKNVFGNPVSTDWGLVGAEYILKDTSKLLYKRVVSSLAKYGTAQDELNDYLRFKTKTYDTTLNNAIIKIELLTQAEGELGVRKVRYSLTNSNGEELESFGSLTLDDDSIYGLVNVLNKASEYVTASWGDKPIEDFINNNDNLPEGIIAYEEGDLYPKDGFFYRALQSDKSVSEKDKTPINIEDPSYWEKFAKAYSPGDIYTIAGIDYRCLTSDYSKSLSDFEPANIQNVIYWSQVKTVSIGEVERSWAVVISGGHDGIEGLTEQNIADALDEFSNPNNIDVYVILTPGWSSKVINAKAQKICEKRGDAMFLPDIPDGLSPQEAYNYIEGKGDYYTNGQMACQYFAVYYPWVEFKTLDANSNAKTIFYPPSIVAARQWCFTDRYFGQWYAPAGKQLQNPRGYISSAVGVRHFVTEDEHRLLYNDSCINPILNYLTEGVVLYGNKTCKRTPPTEEKESLYSSLSTRRLSNYIRKVVSKESRQGIFDPNDSFTHEQWELRVSNILEQIKTKRGIDKYYVSMSSDLEDEKLMTGIIRVKPVFAAEFIDIKFQVTDDDLLFESEE